MPDKLKKWVDDNREFFEERPPLGHKERFKNRLNAKRESMIPEWMRYAASIMLLMGLGWTIFQAGVNSGIDQDAEYQDVVSFMPAELIEVEQFFSASVASKKEELELMAAADGNPEIQSVLAELSILEEQYEELKQELMINTGNERIVNAMIENYRLRLEVLEKLLLKLNKYNIENQTNNEKVNA
ncbi:MAG TPA: hypothetical protein DDX92_03400 [Flavobacteriales bacterium]|jgi:hypothetical protein|nr:hypothetical protein [Flavobacteriales bacterium]